MGQRAMTVGSVALSVAAFTSSWGAVRPGKVQLVDIFLFLAVGCLVIASLAKGLILWARPRPYMISFAVIIILVIVVEALWPASGGYMNQRVNLTGLDQPAVDSVVPGLQWIIAFLVLPSTIMGFAMWRARCTYYVMAAWTLGTGASALVAVIDSMGLTRVSEGLISDVADSAGREAGLASHANSLGVLSAMAIPIAATLWQRRPWLAATSVLLLLAGVLVSGGRGSQAVAVSLLLFLLFFRNSRSVGVRSLVLVGTALTILVIASGALSELLDTFLRFNDSQTAADSDSGRMLLASQAVVDFLERPIFGVGLSEITYAHNIYLQLASAGGVVLTASFLYYIAGVLCDGWHVRQVALGAGIGLSIIAWLVLGIVENNLVDRSLYFPVGALAALAMPRTRL